MFQGLDVLGARIWTDHVLTLYFTSLGKPSFQPDHRCRNADAMQQTWETDLILCGIRTARSCGGGGVDLERIFDLIIFPHPDFPPLLGLLVLHPDLLCMLRNEFPDKTWVPQFAGYAKVFATPHECIGLAAFDSRWDAFGRKVILFATGNRYEPSSNR